VIDRIYCHIVWTTRNREALIDAGLARFLCGFLRGVASQEAARLLEIGMVRTHVHLLVRIRPDQVITGWEGDRPEYEAAGTDEWRSEARKRI